MKTNKEITKNFCKSYFRISSICIAILIALISIPYVKAQTLENNVFIQDNIKILSEDEKNKLNQILSDYNEQTKNIIKINILIQDSISDEQNYFVPKDTIILALNPKTEKYYTLTSENLKNFLPEKEKNEISENNQIFFENHKYLEAFNITIKNIEDFIHKKDKAKKIKIIEYNLAFLIILFILLIQQINFMELTQYFIVAIAIIVIIFTTFVAYS